MFNKFNIAAFPYAEFGGDIKRKVRILVSPQTTEGNAITVVHVEMPPGAISEGHIHEESDEIIYFENDGEAIINNKKYEVRKFSVMIVPKGTLHECRNGSNNEILNLLCIFSPALKPYGLYPQLISDTKQYIDSLNSL